MTNSIKTPAIIVLFSEINPVFFLNTTQESLKNSWIRRRQDYKVLLIFLCHCQRGRIGIVECIGIVILWLLIQQDVWHVMYLLSTRIRLRFKRCSTTLNQKLATFFRISAVCLSCFPLSPISNLQIAELLPHCRHLAGASCFYENNGKTCCHHRGEC